MISSCPTASPSRLTKASSKSTTRVAATSGPSSCCRAACWRSTPTGCSPICAGRSPACPTGGKSAVDLPRPRFQRTLADQRRRDRLGEIAGDQLALLYDKLGDLPLGLVRNLGTLQQRHDDRGRDGSQKGGTRRHAPLLRGMKWRK